MKYVVISSKPIGGGSRVCCAAVPKEKAEETKVSLENTAHTKDFGPFEVIPYQEAEKRKLYGD